MAKQIAAAIILCLITGTVWGAPADSADSPPDVPVDSLKIIDSLLTTDSLRVLDSLDAAHFRGVAHDILSIVQWVPALPVYYKGGALAIVSLIPYSAQTCRKTWPKVMPLTVSLVEL